MLESRHLYRAVFNLYGGTKEERIDAGKLILPPMERFSD